MAKKDYHKWSKDKLVHEIKMLLKRKRFGLVWEDQEEDVATKCENFLPVLSEIKKKKIQNDKTDLQHILIEGDNYHVLSTLCYTHKKKVDVIYIDPPYNTGNKDFVYNDNYKDDKDSYVDKEDRFRHSKWLSFIQKRLDLAKRLLKNNGIIFISIDDNEFAHLKILCDEIFGEDNFIANIIWRKKYGGGKGSNFFVDLHEYILCYSKNKKIHNGFSVERTKQQKEIFKEKDKYFKERGAFYIRPLKSGLALRKTLIYPIKCPDGSEVKTQWICSKSTFKQLKAEGRIVFKKLKNGKYNVYKKFYERDKGGNVLPESIFYDLAYNQNGKEEIKQFFGIQEGRNIPFENPKPVKLISYLVDIACKNKKAIILDFMAGSGTTGQAVLELNQKDNGNRQFILCTNNELNGVGSKLVKSNPKLNKEKIGICQRVCYPRLEKVMNGYTNLKKQKVEGLGGNLRYYKTTFVNQVRTDTDKRKLVNKSTEMLCLTENTFDKVLEEKGFYAVFENSEKMTGIIYDEDAIDDFNEAIKNLKKPLTIYVFSYDHTYNKEDFENIPNLVDVKPIPEVILNVYRKIYKNIRKLKQL